MPDETTITKEDLRISREMLHRLCIIQLRKKYADESVDFSEPVSCDDIEETLSNLLGGKATTPRIWDDREWPKFVRVKLQQKGVD